ncbi:MAG: DNA-binding response regulator [Cyanobacteria bacterium QS_8_64_29]|nr:MAG: DNA-binding response regulator [Cyanobacteria bacterium QS_8_64_29]
MAASADKLRIVIVEDDPMMQLGLEQSLADYPQFEIVAQAQDGIQGVEAARTHQPDIVVMDIGLPRLDGIAATQQVKQSLPGVHVVVLTSHTDRTEVVAALASGADAYCLKGTSVAQLATAIQSAREGATYLHPQIARAIIDRLQPGTGEASYQQTAFSQRELEILNWMVEGYTNPEIAAQLYLSRNTVKTHVRSIMNKLAVDDRVRAAVKALRAGLVQ